MNKNIKTLVLLLGCLFTLAAVQAQIKDLPNWAVIKYYDGSFFMGSIVEEDAVQIKLVITTFDTLHLAKAHIKRLSRPAKDVLFHSKGKFHYTKGCFGSLILTTGYETVGFDLLLGRRHNARLSYGIGVGRDELFTDFNGLFLETIFTPVYGFGRYYLTNKRARLFAFTDAGYGFPVSTFFGADHSGGVYFQPGIGIHFASRGLPRFILTLSQYIQNTKGTQLQQDDFGHPLEFDYNIFYNRTVLRLGIEFR